jgi:hypothetical protein
MRASLLALACWAATAAAAAGEDFVSAWDPKPGWSSTITIDRCRTQERDGRRERGCTRSVYEERILAADEEGLRVGYKPVSFTLTEGPPGAADDAARSELFKAFGQTEFIFRTDPDGRPREVENVDALKALMARGFELANVPTDNPMARQLTNMDAAGMAAVFGQDFMPLALFQDVEIEVGEPITAEGLMPFPLDPSLEIPYVQTMILSRVDREAGRAYGEDRTAYDKNGMAEVLGGWIQSLVQKGAPKEVLDSLRNGTVENTSQTTAEIDLATGATLKTVSTRTIRIDMGGQKGERLDEVTVVRQPKA